MTSCYSAGAHRRTARQLTTAYIVKTSDVLVFGKELCWALLHQLALLALAAFALLCHDAGVLFRHHC